LRLNSCAATNSARPCGIPATMFSLLAAALIHSWRTRPAGCPGAARPGPSAPRPSRHRNRSCRNHGTARRKPRAFRGHHTPR
jgi:hypothetical protein